MRCMAWAFSSWNLLKSSGVMCSIQALDSLFSCRLRDTLRFLDSVCLGIRARIILKTSL